MVTPRRCPATNQHGLTCQSPPLKEGKFCYMHSPDNAEEVAEARRIGGLRRRREVAVSGAYEFDGLETVAGLRRLLMIAALDTLGLENSIARARTLIYLVGVAGKLLETGELEQRIAVLEGAIHRRNNLSESLFDAEPAGSGFSVEVDP